MKTNIFFNSHPVFTYQEFSQFIASENLTNRNTCNSLLAYHLSKGHISRIKKGLYQTIPLGMPSSTFQADPFLVAAKLTEGAVIAYHSALAFYGSTYSVSSRYTYLTDHETKSFNYQESVYKGILFPKKLCLKHQEYAEVKEVDRLGVKILVTSHERTLVDVLDRPDLAGGWEEIWRSLELIEYFDVDKIVCYALLLNNSTTIAKVGFYLEQHSENLILDVGQLKELQSYRPKQPHYMDKNRNLTCELNTTWNLIVPKYLKNDFLEEDKGNH